MNTRNRFGCSPLWYAAVGGKLEVVPLLLARDDVEVNCKLPNIAVDLVLIAACLVPFRFAVVMAPLQQTLKHLIAALVIVGFFGLLSVPGIPNAIQLRVSSLIAPWHSQSIARDDPVQVRSAIYWSYVS